MKNKMAKPSSQCFELAALAVQKIARTSDLKIFLDTMQDHLRFEYKVASFEMKGQPGSFTATVWTDLGQESIENDAWREAWSSFSHTDYIIRRTDRSLKKYSLKKIYDCSLSSTNKGSNLKKLGWEARHFNCTARMTLAVASPGNEYKGLSTAIIFDHTHNHFIENLDVLGLRTSSAETRERFFGYFDEGPSDIAAARAQHALWLAAFMKEKDLGPQEQRVLQGDGAWNPSVMQVKPWFREWRAEKFGAPDATAAQLKEKMEELSDYFHSKGQEVTIRVAEGPDFAACMQNPIMKQACALEEAGILLCIDATKSVDACGTNLFFLVVRTKLFAVPIMAFMTGTLTKKNMLEAFKLAPEVLGSTGFGGKESPDVLMMDDDQSMGEALQEALGALIILRCVFHTLKAIWEWLWARRNGVAEDERPKLLCAARRILYARSKLACFVWYYVAVKKAMENEHEGFADYIASKYARKEEMCIAYRTHLLVRGQHTNNLSERTFRSFKEDVLERVTSYNPVTLASTIATKLEGHLRSKLGDVANRRHPDMLKASHRYRTLKSRMAKVKADTIQHLGAHAYSVPSASSPGVWYKVDMFLGVCQCGAGSDGSLCKHQVFIHHHLDVVSPNIPASLTNEAVLQANYLLGDSTMDTVPSFFLQPGKAAMSQSSSCGLPNMGSTCMTAVAKEGAIVPRSRAPREVPSSACSTSSTGGSKVGALINKTFVSLAGQLSDVVNHEADGQHCTEILNSITARVKNIKHSHDVAPFLRGVHSALPKRTVTGSHVQRRRERAQATGSKKKSARPGKHIKVNNAAVARRSSGRRCSAGVSQKGGSMNKLKRAAAEVLRGDKGKAAEQVPYFKARPTKKKRPQNLSECVEQNKPLGGRKAGSKISKKRGYGF